MGFLFTLCVPNDIRFVNPGRFSCPNAPYGAAGSDVDVLVGRTGVAKFDNQQVGGTWSGQRRRLHKHELTEKLLANGQLPDSLCTRLIAADGLGTISTDLWGNVVHWSSEAQAMFGWDIDEAAGRPLDELLAPVLPDEGRSESPRDRCRAATRSYARGSSRSWPGVVRGRELSQRAARTSKDHPALWRRRRSRAPRVR